MRWSNFCFFTQTKKDSWTDDKLLMMKILHIIAKNDYAIFHQKRDFKLNKKSTQWYIRNLSSNIYIKWIEKSSFYILHKLYVKINFLRGWRSKDLRFSSLQVSLLVSTTLHGFAWMVEPSWHSPQESHQNCPSPCCTPLPPSV